MEYPAYPEYQDSQYAHSLGLPVKWSEKRLKFIASHNDETLSDKTDPDYEIEYIDISSVDLVKGITNIESMTFEEAPSRARRIVKDGDTIVSTIRTYLKSIATIKDPPDNMIVSTGFAVIRPKEELDKVYLSYYLQSQGFVDSVVAHSVGVSYPAINASDLVCLPVIYPTAIEEQQKIANFLDYKTQQIDQLIEKKKALIERLNEQRIAVITQAVTKGIDKNAKMKPSGVDWLGDVPEHWEVVKLRFLLKQKLTNGIFKKAEAWGKGFRVVNVFDVYVHNDIINESLLDRLECDEFEKEKFSAKSGDFFLVRSSLKLEGIGKSATVIDQEEDMVFECHLVRGRPDLQIVHPRYLNLYLNSKSARSYFVSMANTVTMTTIDQSKFKDLAISLPQYDEQHRIIEFVDKKIDQIDVMIMAANKVIRHLGEYRTSLITAAVTGKIDVRQFSLPADQKEDI